MAIFQVKKNALAETRLVANDDRTLEAGEIRVKIHKFALTANNVTYGVVGERIGYWKFFPAADDWGVIPVWGFADIVESTLDEAPVGDRLYGYFPMADQLIMTPGKIKPGRMMDAAAHRADLPPVYNSYARVKADPSYDPGYDDEQILLYPLYATSFCLHDFFLDNGWFGAEQIAVLSASSKTALGVAYALAEDEAAPRSLGVTSPRNEPAVRGLGLYDAVYTYADLTAIDAGKPTAIIDMSGNRAVLGALHQHLGDNMKYCSNVGVTHWDNTASSDGVITERSAMFFAPGHIQKRTTAWGSGVFENKALEFWRRSAKKSRSWLALRQVQGLENLKDAYDDVREARLSAREGVIVTV